MKVLFIGGTGNISKVCAELAVARGYDVTLLNRGKNAGVPGARTFSHSGLGSRGATGVRGMTVDTP